MAWAAAAAWLVLTAHDDLTEARADLRTLRDDADTSELLEESTTTELTAITHQLSDAHGKLRSPVLAPLRVLPVLGRQLRSADAIAGAAAEATSLSAEVLADVGTTLSEAESPETDRVAMLESLAAVAADARVELSHVQLGPDEALIGPLRDARDEFTSELAGLIDLLATVELAASGLTTVLEGPSCYLLFAANNAEMRAGSGMFLQAGELCFDDGHLSLGDLTETGDLVLPATAVDIGDPDLRDRWGFLLPNAEFRNLALSPRFDANAELAADMWRAATGRSVDGVLAVDPAALAVLLDATGPIEVDGQRYDAGNVVAHLLVGQYEGFLDDDYDADERRDRLGEVAGAAVAEFDEGGWSIETLVEALPDAAAGRHLLAWSRGEKAQRAWEEMGVAGTLASDTVAVSVLNRGGGRGGGKLDPMLDVDVEVSVAHTATDGRRDAALEVTLRNPIEPDTPTYAENPDAPDVRFGVYEGILSVNLPGRAGRGRIDDVDGLIAVGSDGPTRVVATPFTLGPQERRTFTVRFDLPAELRSVQVEPSARIPATTWRFRNRRFEDVLPRRIRW